MRDKFQYSRHETSPKSPLFQKTSFQLLLLLLGAGVLSVSFVDFQIKRAPKPLTQQSPSTSAQDSPSTPAPSNQNRERVPSRQVTRESNSDELNNYEEKDPTPEFIAEQKVLLTEEVTTEIRGGELILNQATDPETRKEVTERLAALKRFKETLDRLDPQNPDTWKILESENRTKGKSAL